MDARTEMFQRLDALSKQAQNYRYQGAQQRLDDLVRSINARKTQQPQQPK